MSYKPFTDILGKNKISIALIENIAYFEINEVTYEYYKSFAELLKTCYNYMLDNKVEYVKQYVVEADVELFKGSSLVDLGVQIVQSSDPDIYIVTMPIDVFLENTINAIGMKTL